MKKCTLLFMVFPALAIITYPVCGATLGDYQTKSSGNWNQVSIWEYYNGSAWVNATTTPSYTDNDISIKSAHTVTLTAGLTIDQLTVSGTMVINNGVTLTVNDGSGTDLVVNGYVNVYGVILNKGTISSSTSETTFFNGASYNHNYNGGSVMGGTWNDGSTCLITGFTSDGSLTNTDQSFYNFTWNCEYQTAETNLAGNLETIRGTFTMMSTGSTGKLKLAESADYTLTISGNWNHQGGTLNMGGGSSYAYIYLLGNFSMSGGKITEANSSGYTARISFSKNGEQTYSKSSGTFENNIDFEIVSGSILNMGTSIADGSLGIFSVNSAGTLKTSHTGGIATSGATGCIQTSSRYYSFAANYHYCANGAQATGNGLPSPLSGKLMIGSATAATSLTLTNGSVTINGTLLLCSSNSANSAIVSGTVAYGATGTLEYQGMSAQTTNLKEWPASSPPYHVNLNNGYGVNLGFDRTVNGTMTLAIGTFSLGSNTLTLNGTLTKSSGSLNGGCNSNIAIGGASGTSLDLPDVTLGTLILNRSASGVRLTGNVVICTTMVMTSGAVTLAPSKTLTYQAGSRLKYNGTANQTTAAEEFPVTSGPPSLEIAKPSGTTLNLNFSRTLNENLYLTGGAFSIGSNTLTLNGLITPSSGTLVGGGTSSITFAGSSATTSLPPVTLQNLTINRAAGIHLGGHVTLQGTLSLTQGDLFLDGYQLTINGLVTRTSGGLSGSSSSSIYFGINPSATMLPPVLLGTLGINRSAGITMDGDVSVQNTLTLTAGALSIGAHKLTLNGSLAYSGGTLTGGSTSDMTIGGSAGSLALQSITLQRLVIDRLAGVSLSGDLQVMLQLDLLNGALNLNGWMLTLYGGLGYLGGSMAGGGTSGLSLLGTATQLTLQPVTIQTLNLNRTAGLSLAGDLVVTGLFNYMNGVLNRNGYQLYGPAATLRYSGGAALTTSDEEFPATGGPCNLSVMNPQPVKLHDNRYLQGNVELFTGTLNLNNKTLSLGGTFIQVFGQLQGGADSHIHFDPGPDPGTLPMVTLGNLRIDRAAGVSMQGNCTLYGGLELVDGTFTISGTNTLYLYGDPVSGDPMNCQAMPSSGLQLGGSAGGMVVPSGINEIGMLTIDNSSGVSLDHDLTVWSSMKVQRSFNLGEHTVTGPGSALIAPGAKLISSHSMGIEGNIQLTGPQGIDGQVDYEFNGSADQVTGFLPTSPPATIKSLVISNTEPNTVTLNSDVTVTGNVDIRPGAKFIVDSSYQLTVLNDLMVH